MTKVFTFSWIKIFFTTLLILISLLVFPQAPKINTPSSNNSYHIPDYLWNSYLKKTAALLEKVDLQSFMNYVVISADGNMDDMPYFMEYVKSHSKKDFEVLTYKAGKGDISSEADVKAYLGSIQPAYKKYFDAFQKNREGIIKSQQQKRGPSNPDPNVQTCGSACTNPGFESGNTFWQYWAGNPAAAANPATLTAGFNPPTTGTHQNQHLVTAVGGFDPNVGGTILPIVPPGGGNHAFRLGDTVAWGGIVPPIFGFGGSDGSWGAARASISFTVSASNANFTYRYAVVIEDPNDSSHSAINGFTQRPYFRVKLRDQNGVVLTCGDYEVIADASQPNFTSIFTETAPGSNIWYRQWTTVFVPLSSYIGQCVSLEFTASDCVLGGHMGYGYVDCACEPLAIISSSPNVCGGHSVTLTAPPGGATYVWSDSATGTIAGIVGSSTLQTAVVNQAGTYKVVITSVTGSACQTTLYVTIGTNPSLPVAQFTNTTVCPGVPMQFTDSSTPVGSINGWKWDFNNDGIPDDSTQNPTHIFPAAGTYPVTLIVKWGACTADTVINVNVNTGAPPVLTPAGPFCANAAAVNLTASLTGGTWSGPGITSGTAGTFTPSVSIVGFDTVTYTGGGGCAGPVSEAINVLPIPIAAAGADVNICTGTLDSIGTASSAGYTYAWLPAAGLSSDTISNPHIITVNNGNMPIITTYTLTVTQATCSSTDQVIVTVSPIPVLTITNPAPVCSPGTIDITAASVTAGSTGGGTLSYWHDTTALVPLSSPAAITASGTYYIKATSVGGGCSDIKPVAVTINPLPVSDAGTDLMLCSSGSGTIGGPSVAGYTYVWLPSTGISSSSTISNPTVSLINPGPSAPITTTYTVTTTETATGCQSAADVHVVVNAVATVNAGSSQHVCAGSAITLGGSVGGSATSGTWSGGAGIFSPSNAALNAVYTPTAAEYAADSVILTLTTNDPPGPCTFATSNVILHFYNAPLINFSVANPTGCPPLHCAQFTDLSSITGGSIVSSVWDFGDGSPGSNTQNPAHCYSVSNYYDVTLTETSDHGCTSTLTLVHLIHVFLLPVAQFSTTPNPASVLDPIVTFNNQSSSDVNYWFWSFGDGFTASPNDPNPVHEYPHDTSSTFTATLIVHNADGCFDTIPHQIFIGPAFCFYIPNAFTPNGDGINDYFFGTGIGILNYDMRIFDRWGNMIFHGKDLTSKWDGIANNGNEKAQIDVYVWKVSLTDVFYKSHDYIGTVTLVK